MDCRERNWSSENRKTATEWSRVERLAERERVITPILRWEALEMQMSEDNVYKAGSR
jgi:hypothetical protein